jgi:hypothetical protein
MGTFFKWFSGFFEDQGNYASSKRLTLYIALFYFGFLVRGSLDGKVINDEVLFTTGGIILFCIGAVTSEFFKKSNKSE